MQAEQGIGGTTASNRAMQDTDVTTAVKHTTSNDTSQSGTSSSSSDQGIAETAVTAVCVDTSATSNTRSCSNTSEGTVTEIVTATTAAPSTTSSIVINSSSSSSSTVLSQVKLAVDTKEQTVSSITDTVKVSVLHCDDLFTPVKRTLACVKQYMMRHVVIQFAVHGAYSSAVALLTRISHANIFSNF
jgi:hypothetical protein